MDVSPYYRQKIADFCVSRVRPRFSGLITGEMLGQRLALTRAVWSDLVTWEMLIQSVAGEMMVSYGLFTREMSVLWG